MIKVKYSGHPVNVQMFWEMIQENSVLTASVIFL